MIYFGYCAFLFALLGFSYAIVAIVVARFRSLHQQSRRQPRKAYVRRKL